MNFPFTSRGRLDDAYRTIERLERELLDLKQDRKRLTDLITVKSFGISVYGEVPVPREFEDEPAPRKYSPEKDSAEPIIVKRETEQELPRRARDVARQVQQENLAQAERDQEQLNRLIQQERLKEIVKAELAPVIEEGKKAAETSSNGRH